MENPSTGLKTPKESNIKKGKGGDEYFQVPPQGGVLLKPREIPYQRKRNREESSLYMYYVEESSDDTKNRRYVLLQKTE